MLQIEKQDSSPMYSHKRVIHRYDEYLAGILELGRIEIARDVVFGTRRREGRGNACAVREGSQDSILPT
jgi:hypothetical protein